MDLVEVSPPFDHAEITAIAAATIAHDWLAVLAKQKTKQKPEPARSSTEFINIKRSDGVNAYLSRNTSV